MTDDEREAYNRDLADRLGRWLFVILLIAFFILNILDRHR